MNGITSITFLIASFVVVCHGHYNGRLHKNMCPVQNFHRDYPSTCSCSCDDLGALVTLVRTLEDSSSTPSPNGNINNADNLIMNLVNALIQLTTQALSRNNCHCPNQSGTNNNSKPSQNGGSDNHKHNGGSGNNNNNNNGYSHSDGGLLNLDLLNPNKKDNVLDLDLGKQHVLGVGLRGGGSGTSRGSDSYNTNGRSAGGVNDEGLINVDLLNPNKKNNVAQVDLGNQPLVGVGLLGGGGSDSVPSQTTNSMTGSVSNASNIEEGLINVDLLNSNKQNNVADVDIVKHTVIGIGLGNKNDSTV